MENSSTDINWFGGISVALGIFGVVFNWLSMCVVCPWWFGLVLGIIALLQEIKRGGDKFNRVMAIIGIVLGIVNVVWMLLNPGVIFL